MAVIVKEKRTSPVHAIPLPDGPEDGNVLVYEADTETWEPSATAPPAAHTHGGEDITSSVAEADHADDADTVGGESPDAFADAKHDHPLEEVTTAGGESGQLPVVSVGAETTTLALGPVATATPTASAVPIADASGKLDVGWINCVPLPAAPSDMDSLVYEAKTNAWTPSSALTAPASPTISSATGANGIIKVLVVQSPAENVDGWELVYDPSDATDPDTLHPFFSKSGQFEFPAPTAEFVWVRAVRGTAHSAWVTTPLFTTEYSEDPITGTHGADVTTAGALTFLNTGTHLLYNTSLVPGETVYASANGSQSTKSFAVWPLASGVQATEYGVKMTTAFHMLNNGNAAYRCVGMVCGADSTMISSFGTATFYTLTIEHWSASDTRAYLHTWVGSTATLRQSTANIWSSASIQVNGWNDVIFERNGSTFTVTVNGVLVATWTDTNIVASAARSYVGLVYATNTSQYYVYGDKMLVESRNGVTTAIAPGPFADSNLLDAHDSSYFATADHMQTLAKGGTNADLSATGGTAQVLRQSSTGAAVTVGTLKLTECADADNNTWLQAVDFAGTGTVNMMKVNASDELEIGALANLPGPIEFPQDAGVVSLFDMPVVSAVDETLMAVAMKIAGQVVARILGYSTGAGAIDKLALEIMGDLLPSVTNVGCLGSATKAYKELHLHDGTDEKKVTVDANGNITVTAE